MKFFRQSFTGYVVRYTSRKPIGDEGSEYAGRKYLLRRLNAVYRRRLAVSGSSYEALIDVKRGDPVLVNGTPYEVVQVGKLTFTARKLGDSAVENIFHRINGICLDDNEFRAVKVS
ncbi:MAG: hypothetical protein KKA81_02305 [Bacteroidetes bacterium]|nr:hypothetical protein [Bacteroidota bacterium]